MNCHIRLTEYIGQEIAEGIIENAWTMLHPRNDMFVVRTPNGKPKRFLRRELSNPILDERTAEWEWDGK